jgi:hypothetical protein
MKLNAVSEVDSLFSHGRLVWFFKTNVPLMLVQPGFHGTACLPIVDLASLAGESVYTRCPKSQVIFDRPEKTGYFLGRQAH